MIQRRERACVVRLLSRNGLLIEGNLRRVMRGRSERDQPFISCKL